MVPSREGREAPEEGMMDKVKVTFTYKSGRMSWSRYGHVQRVETAVRFVEEDDLDEVLDQFRCHHKVIEVTISKR